MNRRCARTWVEKKNDLGEGNISVGIRGKSENKQVFCLFYDVGSEEVGRVDAGDFCKKAVAMCNFPSGGKNSRGYGYGDKRRTRVQLTGGLHMFIHSC